MLSEETIRMLEPDMVEWRRHFHRHPELSFQEYRTSERIAGLLESWGLEVRRGIAGTGVIGTLRGARPGKNRGAQGGYRRIAHPGPENVRIRLPNAGRHARLRT